MQRISQVSLEGIPEQTKSLFDAIHDKHGCVPNFYKTLANSPAALAGFVALEGSLETGVLSSELREQLAITVSQASESHYCLTTHEILGKSVGLTEEKISDARRARSPCRQTEAALRFARTLVEKRGRTRRDELESLYSVGYSDEEITELIAIVGWKLFANYFNHVAETELDEFP
ncbi:MAG: carboxymuconolactone decarboxylase family protein [Planctomycetota bacterium]|nr:carboxymuconolactone decarboxylase family protein [Planctomycetota bacterium]